MKTPTIKSGSGPRLAAKGVLFFLIGLGLASGRESPAAGQPWPVTGRVVRVADGDTVTVLFADRVERRVRLIGVDAPEMDDSREDVAYRAFLSQRFAFHHLYLREVRLTYDFNPQDEHGRTLAYVWLGEGELFNERIIREGFAAAFLKYPFRKDYQDRFRAAEVQARKEDRGLWRREEPAAVPVSEVRSHAGGLVSVRFRCARVSRKRAFITLESEEGLFEAVIPRDRLGFFPDAAAGAGKEVTVSGFLEEFKGRPQVMITFPRQLRLT
jgi:micrococcal nuclease